MKTANCDPNNVMSCVDFVDLALAFCATVLYKKIDCVTSVTEYLC
jgi:hypothetical protein